MDWARRPAQIICSAADAAERALPQTWQSTAKGAQPQTRQSDSSPSRRANARARPAASQAPATQAQGWSGGARLMASATLRRRAAHRTASGQLLEAQTTTPKPRAPQCTGVPASRGESGSARVKQRAAIKEELSGVANSKGQSPTFFDKAAPTW